MLLHLLLACAFAEAACAGVLPASFLRPEEIDLFCLRLSYPAASGIWRDNNGAKWLRTRNGMNVPYEKPNGINSELNVDLKSSLAQIYPLEPERPASEVGHSPGRARSYDFFFALYGTDAPTVRKGLRAARFNGKAFSLAEQAAQAFGRAAPKLEALAGRPEYKKFLKPDGSFYWRKIAGENRLSSHSFGIAIDLGADAAPYWRWSRQMPHPMQKSYPTEIVRIMEEHGFIWGGKWHEYDLMHFEYRPEILCKARMLKHMRDQGKFSTRRMPQASSIRRSSSNAKPEAVK